MKMPDGWSLNYGGPDDRGEYHPVLFGPDVRLPLCQTKPLTSEKQVENFARDVLKARGVIR